MRVSGETRPTEGNRPIRAERRWNLFHRVEDSENDPKETDPLVERPVRLPHDPFARQS
jgi:hypothetical protein